MVEDNFDDLNLDDAFQVEEDAMTLDSVRIQKNQVDPRSISNQLDNNKLHKLEEQLAKVTNALENGRKTTYMDGILQKYDQVDPIFKQMLIDMNIASNEFTKENLKQIQGYFADMQAELAQLKEEQKNLSDYTSNIHTDVTTHRLVRKYLERGFKKNTIKEEHVEKALEEHTKRLSRDEAYVLRLQNIWNTPNFDVNAKNRLTGQLILENFRDVAVKAKGKKAEELPTAKKTIEKDAQVEKAAKKMEKIQATEEEDDTPKPEIDRNLQDKLRNKIRRF